MVKWFVKFSDGGSKEGITDDGSWGQLAIFVNKNHLKITEFYVENKHGRGTIDPNCNGYFLSNKITSTFPTGQETKAVGIGYYRLNESVVRIKWYDANTMGLLNTEARRLEDCGISLIQN